MTRWELIERIAQAITRVESMDWAWLNPGAIRQWRVPKEYIDNPSKYGILLDRCQMFNGRLWYPMYKMKNHLPESLCKIDEGFISFREAFQDPKNAFAEGQRVLRVLVDQYINGTYTNGIPPSLERMFQKYAPREDRNNPGQYAKLVSKFAGISLINTPLVEFIDAA